MLKALGKATTPWREKLGESLTSLERFNTPLAQATTSSLEALKAYTQGVVSLLRDEEHESIPIYKRAIELDPDFALAHRNLSVSYWNLGEYGLSTEYARKAFELKDHASERGKLEILEMYHWTVNGDLDKSIEIQKMMIATYPRIARHYNWLGVSYLWAGRLKESMAEIRKFHSMLPTAFSFGMMTSSAISLNKFDLAKSLIEEARRLQRDSGITNSLLVLAILEEDTKTMDNQVWR